MSKKRVYELAKELEVTTKDMMNLLQKQNIQVKSHMAMLTSDEVEQVKKAAKGDTTNQNEKKKVEKKEKSQPVKKQDDNKKAPKPKDDTLDDKPAEPRGKQRNQQKQKNKPNQGKNQQGNRNQRNQKNQKNQKNNQRKEQPKKEMPAVNYDKPVEIENNIVVKDLSQKLGISVSQLIGKLMMLGVMANQNQEISFEYAELVASEFNRTVVLKEAKQQLDTESETGDIFGLDFEDKEEDLQPRPPVITVMGHVDHGKTSLLDAIRKTHVTKGEAGGITQHIGAYTINLHGQKVVFLDTPGHEAFTTMRARGAMVTDIAVLVVAADDGVMPQTIEAINHAKAANVPMIVAINKMDRAEANPDRVKQELAEHDVVTEDWGGDTIMVGVSAITREGIDDLLEMILMLAEMQELKANPKRAGIGTIIEAQLDKGRGPVATVIVEKGTFSQQDFVVTGAASGRIRAMFDDKGKKANKVGPSFPVQIQGLSEVPNAGDKIFVVEDDKTARSYADLVKAQQREDMIQRTSKVSLDDLFDRIQQGELKDLNIVVKTDVRGTIDAVRQSFEKLGNEEVRVNIIHGAVGGITESDVQLATASNALIIGFNVRPNQAAMEMAKNESVDIRTYRVIYEAIDDVKDAIHGMLAPKYEEEVLGRAEIRQTFRVPNAGTVAGINVRSGKITRNAQIRLIRDDVVVYEGLISSLKRFKDDVREIATGYEGGLSIENYNDIKEGDVVEAFQMKEIQQ